MHRTGQLLHHVVQFVHRPADDERMYFEHDKACVQPLYDTERWHFYQTKNTD